MGKDIISIIIPVYQAEQWLRDSVNSVLKQTYKDIEILLVDDGSTDSSGRICDELGAEFPQIQALHQKNLGVSAARNKGLSLAKGKYILFLDSDDSIQENTLEFTLNIMRKEHVDIVFFNYIKCYDTGKEEFITVDLEEGAYESKSIINAFMKLIDANIANNIGTKLYRREVLNNVFFDESVSIYEDVRFCLEAVQHAKRIYFYNNYFYHYECKNTNSLIHSYKKEYYFSLCKFLKALRIFGDKETDFECWYAKEAMEGLRGAVRNAKMDKNSFRQEFQKICDNKEMKNAKDILKRSHYAGLSLKSVIQFYMMWNRCYLGVKFLWH